MYYLISSLFLLFMGIIWKINTFPNVFCKTIFLGLGFWGLFNYAEVLGYVIKA